MRCLLKIFRLGVGRVGRYFRHGRIGDEAEFVRLVVQGFNLASGGDWPLIADNRVQRDPGDCQATSGVFAEHAAFFASTPTALSS